MAAKELKVGDIAPDFQAKNENGELLKLSDYLGKKVILFFYPKDNTPGCTTESCNFRDHYEDLQEKGFEVIGVSVDSEASHQRFKAKHKLPFTLISDTEKELVTLYGVWKEKSLFGKKYMGTLRTTFVIDEKGKIISIIDKVKNSEATQQILESI